MRILVLEGTTGLRSEVVSELFPEGFGMLRTFINEFDEAGFEVVTTLNSEILGFEDWLCADEVYPQNRLEDALNDSIDAALIIAPEDELPRIIRKIGEKNIPLLGPSLESVKIAGDKWETYKELRGIVPQPETWNEFVEEESPLFVKPRSGVGAEGVQLVSSGQDTFLEEDVVFQKPIQGVHASCCLLIKNGEGAVLSVNGQKIVSEDNYFEYVGGRIPLENSKKEECGEVALEAAKELGLKGYCGVDLVIGDKPYFMELNPRTTTSFVGLPKILEKNLGTLLTETLLENKPIPDPKLEGGTVFRILKINEKTTIPTEKIDKLKQIPEIISPPYAPKGKLEKDAPISLVLGKGKDSIEAKRKMENGIMKALNILDVDENVVSWN